MSAILNITKTIQYFKIKSCLHFEALFPFWKNNLDLIKKVRFESTTRQLYFNKSNQRKIFRNDGELSVHNFHSVSKIFDMFSQMCSCFDPRLSKYQYSFKEGYSVQRYVLPMEIGKFLNNNAIHAALLANCFLQNFTLLIATSPRWNSFIRI